jgi:major membrane immunogen (membrane-anchored lipoprotein)
MHLKEIFGGIWMKKKILLSMLMMFLMTSLIGCGVMMKTNDSNLQNGAISTIEKSIKYKDGSYEAKTPIDGEGFYTTAKVTVSGGKISEVDWIIFDNYRGSRPFDASYEKVYVGNEVYIQQSRSDWKGSRNYGQRLIETQDLGKVDVVTGATWTNKKFKEAVGLALEKAKE